MAKEATQQLSLPKPHDGIIRRSVDISVRAVNEEERSLEVVASTDTLDSHGDIVEQTFDLKRYKKNPVVLWLHNAFGYFDGARAEDWLPIGRADKVRVSEGKLEAKLYFVNGDPEHEPLVDKIWRRISQQVLRAVSIGFRPGKVTEESTDGGVVYRLAENELFEISVVPMGSNPDAVAKSHARDRAELARRAHPPGGTQPTEKPMGAENDNKAAEELGRVKGELATATSKVKDLEGQTEKMQAQIVDLNAEKSKLETECKTLRERVAKADETERESRIKGYLAEQTVKAEDGKDKTIGPKITPGEVDGLIELAKTAGTDAVCKSLETRPDIKLTSAITRKGNPLHREDDTPAPGNGGNDLSKAADEEIAKERTAH